MRKNQPTEKIKEEIKNYLQTNENEKTAIQNLWDSAKIVLRGKKTRKISNKQPNITPKGSRKSITNKTHSQQKEGNHKDQSRNK